MGHRRSKQNRRLLNILNWNHLLLDELYGLLDKNWRLKYNLGLLLDEACEGRLHRLHEGRPHWLGENLLYVLGLLNLR